MRITKKNYKIFSHIVKSTVIRTLYVGVVNILYTLYTYIYTLHTRILLVKF